MILCHTRKIAKIMYKFINKISNTFEIENKFINNQINKLYVYNLIMFAISITLFIIITKHIPLIYILIVILLLGIVKLISKVAGTIYDNVVAFIINKTVKYNINQITTIFNFEILGFTIFYYLIFNICSITALIYCIPFKLHFNYSLLLTYSIITLISIYNIKTEQHGILKKYFNLYLHYAFLFTFVCWNAPYKTSGLFGTLIILLLPVVKTYLYIKKDKQHNIAQILVTLGNYKLAHAIINKLIINNDKDLKLYYLRHICNFNLDNYDESAKDLAYVKNAAKTQDRALYDKCCKEINIWKEV